MLLLEEWIPRRISSIQLHQLNACIGPVRTMEQFLVTSIVSSVAYFKRLYLIGSMACHLYFHFFPFQVLELEDLVTIMVVATATRLK